ncbi:MAG: acyltransferase [Proteus hauseri]|nr:acyltransferase [Proteus hauseri]
MERILWVDVARVIAIFLVVFTHAHEVVAYGDIYTKSIFYSMDRLAVPIFIMISGGLILPKLSNVNILSFYKKRIPQFILLIIFYSIFTSAIKYMTDGTGFYDSFLKAAIENNGITNNNKYPGSYGYARQMWYMYMIVQLYLMAPFISKMVTNTKTSHLVLFIFICLFFNQMKDTLYQLGIEIDFISKLGKDFTGPFIAYFVAGYVIMCRDPIKLLDNNITKLLLLIIPCLALLYIDVTNNKVNWSLHWYPRSLFIFFSSIGFILLIKEFFNKTNNKIISFISYFSFGVYLAHYAFIFITLKIMKIYGWDDNKTLLLISLLVIPIIMSLIYAKIMSLNKYTKKLVC